MDWFRNYFQYSQNPIYFMTAFFALFIFCGVFNSFNTRTNRVNLFAHLNSNIAFLFIMFVVTVVQILLVYYGGSLFRTAGLTVGEMALVLALAFSVIPADLIRKLILKLLHRPRTF